MTDPQPLRSPYQIIKPGGDAVDESTGSSFRDFGPRPIPSDAAMPAPKASHAPASVTTSPVSLVKNESKQETPAPVARVSPPPTPSTSPTPSD